MKELHIYEKKRIVKNNNIYNFFWSEEIFSSSIYKEIFSHKQKGENDLKKELNIELKGIFNKKINKKKISEIFNLDRHFSLAIFSNLIEKNPYKDNFHLDIAKILILKKFIKKKNIKKIKIFSSDIKLKIKLEKFLNYNKKYSASFKLNSLTKFTLSFIKSLLVVFIYIIKNINLFQIEKKINCNKPLFVSFFSYTSSLEALKGNYVSEYWRGFKETKDKNWLHLFDEAPSYKNSNSVRDCIDKINKKSKKNNHFFLNNYLTFFVSLKFILKALLLFFQIIIFKFRLKKLKFEMYEILLIDFYVNELISINCFRNILLFYQFKNFFSKNKISSNIFFCMENQPWEKILLYFLKKLKNKYRNYGVIHSSLRFWDLRMMKLGGENKIKGYQNPDYILSNSKFATKILINNGFNIKKIILTETLRYHDVKFKYLNNFNKDTKKKVFLILSDYDDAYNDFLKTLILDISKEKNIFIYLKCHKLKPLNITQKNLKIIKNFSQITKKINFALVSNFTSASLDLHYMGFRPFVYKKTDSFDYSPLYRFVNYNKFSSSKALKILTKKYKSNARNKKMRKNSFKDYFFIDKNFIIWKKLITDEFRK